jgi:hypothetical protein
MSTTIDVTNAAVFGRPESKEWGYWRNVDTISNVASCAILRDVGGRECIDLLSSAGSLNYRRNDPHLIAAGRYHRIPGGHDAPGIASGDARRGEKRTIGRMTPRSRGEEYPVGIHSAALTEYLMRDGTTHGCGNTTEQRTALR